MNKEKYHTHGICRMFFYNGQQCNENASTQNRRKCFWNRFLEIKHVLQKWNIRGRWRIFSKTGQRFIMRSFQIFDIHYKTNWFVFGTIYRIFHFEYTGTYTYKWRFFLFLLSITIISQRKSVPRPRAVITKRYRLKIIHNKRFYCRQNPIFNVFRVMYTGL